MPNNTFYHLDGVGFINEKTDLLLSLDVIYHLIEDEVYDRYINNIVNHGSPNIIIYSANYESSDKFATHVRPRKFTENKTLSEKYNLVTIIKNKYPSTNHKKGSFSDWYIFKLK